MNNDPIGVFDSGLGGLTVVKQLIKILPHEDIVYLGDSARVPYGTRSKEIIIKFSFEDVNFLLKKHVKCIVIACNTASALAGKELKKKLKIPIFDVITPTLNYAKSISKSGRIGVIGTYGTIKSGTHKKQLQIIDNKLQITEKACPLFVSFIEEGETNSKALKLIAKDCLSNLKKEKVDTLIMGCTHYPIIKNIIQNEVGKKVNLIDPGRAVAEELKYSLTKDKMLNNQNRIGKRKYFVTDLTDRFTKVAEMFLGHNLDAEIKKVNL